MSGWHPEAFNGGTTFLSKKIERERIVLVRLDIIVQVLIMLSLIRREPSALYFLRDGSDLPQLPVVAGRQNCISGPVRLRLRPSISSSGRLNNRISARCLSGNLTSNYTSSKPPQKGRGNLERRQINLRMSSLH